MTQKISFEYHREHAMPGKGPGVVMQGISGECFDEIVAVVSNNWMGSEEYTAKRGVDPFLQGMDRTSGWLFVEFWGGDAGRRNAYAERIHKIFMRHHMTPSESIPFLGDAGEVMHSLYNHYTQTASNTLPFQHNGHIVPVIYSIHNPDQSSLFQIKTYERVIYREWKGDGPLFILCSPQAGLRFPRIVRLHALKENGVETLHDFGGVPSTIVATLES